MAWDGDISRMGRLVENLGALASVPSKAAKAVSEEIATLIDEQFDAGMSPYFQKWQPLAPATIAKGRFPPPLTDTGAMRGSVVVKPMQSAGVSVTIDHPAAPHQTGWSGSRGSGPARPVLPQNTLPGSWREAIRQAVEESAKATLKGKK